jgi:hypothetical protein
MMRVKPAPGLKVRCPLTKHPLPDEGMEVPCNTYWIRRLAAGDVLVVETNQIPDSRLDEV